MARGELMRLSPRCPVIWGPWETSTSRLQAAGWELHVAEVGFEHDIQLVVTHRQLELIGVSRRTSWSRKCVTGEGAPPVFHMQAVSHRFASSYEPPIRYALEGTLDGFRPIDARAMVVETDHTNWNLLFAPLKPQAPEFVLSHENLGDVLDSIRRMQMPEQAAIRQRAAARERRESALQFHASLATLAA